MIHHCGNNRDDPNLQDGKNGKLSPISLLRLHFIAVLLMTWYWRLITSNRVQLCCRLQVHISLAVSRITRCILHSPLFRDVKPKTCRRRGKAKTMGMDQPHNLKTGHQEMESTGHKGEMPAQEQLGWHGP